MLWQSSNDGCDVCQCSRLMKNSFQVSDGYSDNDHDHSFSHHTDCSTYDNIDKENHRIGSPVKHDNDISLYGSTSPSTNTRCRNMCSPTTKCLASQTRRSLEEFDLNSQDSGYGTSLNDRETKINFNFAAQTSSSSSSSSNNIKTTVQKSSVKCKEDLFNSFSSGSMESMDDSFLELADLETVVDDNAVLPCDFNSLISGSLKNVTPVSNQTRIRPSFRRSISLKEGTPVSRARHCLFKPDTPELFENRSFKRPEPPLELTSPIQSKRYKFNEMKELVDSEASIAIHPKIQRSLSANEATIMSAVQRSSADPDLIGDFSKPFCLPLVSGKHQDLKSITPSTLAELLRGTFNNAVASYKVIDCRYPYEFEGGHISGALNYYTKEQIERELVENKCCKTSLNLELTKRHILVFHCEFSSERGPNLSRFLRNLDRVRNHESYPALDYPEIYLLDGGYKNFYEKYSELCEPTAYKSMLDPAHEHDLKHFRAKSKTWNADTRGRFSMRSAQLKRSCIL